MHGKCCLKPFTFLVVFLIRSSADRFIAMLFNFQIILWLNLIKMIQCLNVAIGWWCWLGSCCRFVDKNSRSGRFC